MSELKSSLTGYAAARATAVTKRISRMEQNLNTLGIPKDSSDYLYRESMIMKGEISALQSRIDFDDDFSYLTHAERDREIEMTQLLIKKLESNIDANDNRMAEIEKAEVKPEASPSVDVDSPMGNELSGSSLEDDRIFKERMSTLANNLKEQGIDNESPEFYKRLNASIGYEITTIELEMKKARRGFNSSDRSVKEQALDDHWMKGIRLESLKEDLKKNQDIINAMQIARNGGQIDINNPVFEKDGLFLEREAYTEHQYINPGAERRQEENFFKKIESLKGVMKDNGVESFSPTFLKEVNKLIEQEISDVKEEIKKQVAIEEENKFGGSRSDRARANISAENNRNRLTHLEDQYQKNNIAIDVMQDRAQKAGLGKEFAASMSDDNIFPSANEAAIERFSNRVMNSLKNIKEKLSDMMHREAASPEDALITSGEQQVEEQEVRDQRRDRNTMDVGM